ncbi:hypothetical protein D0T49_05225 [Paludibacter sp. 221]|uniref:hypothetical protein n=1 Tax=Paludibacter sp. 221 TaxID=2302939 RepID=UPI0013D5281E|nr:hypothetical protein [Paludibacter sp. 221]NDV46441.1 hypothetical protein [Paludibacter sp. 221]
MKKIILIILIATGGGFFLINNLLSDKSEKKRTIGNESVVVFTYSDVSEKPVDISLKKSDTSASKKKSDDVSLPNYVSTDKNPASQSQKDMDVRLGVTMKSTSTISLLNSKQGYNVVVDELQSPTAQYVYQAPNRNIKKRQEQIVYGGPELKMYASARPYSSVSESAGLFLAVRNNVNLLSTNDEDPGESVDPGYNPPMNEIEGPVSPAIGVLLLFSVLYLVRLFSRKTLLKKHE